MPLQARLVEVGSGEAVVVVIMSDGEMAVLDSVESWLLLVLAVAGLDAVFGTALNRLLVVAVDLDRALRVDKNSPARGRARPTGRPGYDRCRRNGR